MSTQLLIKANVSYEKLQACVAYVQELESLLSAYKSESEVVAVNKMAGKGSVKCSEATLEVIALALEIAKHTDGAFDPTIGALSHYGYGFGFSHAHVLDPNKAKAQATHVDHKELVIEENTVRLSKAGMALDLGGVAKGFAAQKALESLQDLGATKILVSIGGEIACIGKHWNIGIAHPGKKEQLFALLTTHKDLFTISSSGTYERFIHTQEHHHILDPKNGQSKKAQGALTLISTQCDLGRLDALNTALFSEKIIDRQLQERYHFETLSIEVNGEFKISEAFTKKVKRFRVL